VSRQEFRIVDRDSSLFLVTHAVAEPGGVQGVLKLPLPPWLPWKPPQAPLQILWRKKKEGENFEEEEGMRGGRRKKERRAPLALDPGSAAGSKMVMSYSVVL